VPELVSKSRFLAVQIHKEGYKWNSTHIAEILHGKSRLIFISPFQFYADFKESHSNSPCGLTQCTIYELLNTFKDEFIPKYSLGRP
jgi:hypothetical protein